MLSLGLPRGVAIIPYLFRNRGVLYLPMPDLDEAAAVDREPLVGVRPSAWRPRREEGIVVDDLDPGFGIESVDNGDEGDWRSWLTVEPDHRADLDHGLPVLSTARPPVGEWFREETRWSWGKYRRTVARAAAGDGRRNGVFTVELPSEGRWRRDYHLPGRTAGGLSGGTAYEDQGRYDMRLEAGGEETVLEFDASAAELGWNHLGDFALMSGQARLVVSNLTSGQFVIADAVRWRPVDHPRR